jgi:D-glycero-alpha-D-manno-heptose-7-phosphate kinase
MVILARAPLRVSWFGGGSDIPEFYNSTPLGGATVSMAINKYVYVAVSRTPNKHIKLSYMKQELVTDVNDLEHDIVRETLKFFKFDHGLEINTWADVPTVGSGLGGSSAFTCALICAMFKLVNYTPTPLEVAEIASDIEINKCGYRIGKQDQYASALGGFNFIRYVKDDTWHKSITLPFANDIANHCVLIPTGITRNASDVLKTVDIKKKKKYLLMLAELANRIPYCEDITPEVFGKGLSHAWNIKKDTSDSISNLELDNLYEKIISIPYVTGAKLLGAGGGGYFLAMVEYSNQRYLMAEFPDKNCLTFNPASSGASVVYND